jgi:hypothetical protein
MIGCIDGRSKGDVLRRSSDGMERGRKLEALSGMSGKRLMQGRGKQVREIWGGRANEVVRQGSRNR